VQTVNLLKVLINRAEYVRETEVLLRERKFGLWWTNERRTAHKGGTHWEQRSPKLESQRRLTHTVRVVSIKHTGTSDRLKERSQARTLRQRWRMRQRSETDDRQQSQIQYVAQSYSQTLTNLKRTRIPAQAQNTLAHSTLTGWTTIKSEFNCSKLNISWRALQLGNLRSETDDKNKDNRLTWPCNG